MQWMRSIEDNIGYKIQNLFMQTQQQPIERSSPSGHQSRLAQYSAPQWPLPLVDDFCAVPSEHLDSGIREAKG
ncbi:hypothetical protein MSG28_008494 [Choristoneura fumiferana]|uniref:Uncharacterized protein n=1 Tax=Choristoneura fumiferana TaxID=7141 RepID=A0ACC0J6S7_CHOFU|nr:hypothetical protein MSG28_008494 [Choristoneura fumiferana]